MTRRALVIGSSIGTDRIASLDKCLAQQGFSSIVVADWNDWAITLYPLTGDVALVNTWSGERIGKNDVQALVMLGSPSLPAVDPEDAAFQGAEYEAFLFGLCALVKPSMSARWAHLLSGMSDTDAAPEELVVVDRSIVAISTRLREAGAIEAVIAGDIAVFVRASGEVKVLALLERPFPAIPITLRLAPNTSHVTPFIGLVPHWLLDAADVLWQVFSRSCLSGPSEAFWPQPPEMPTHEQRDSMTIVGHRRLRSVRHLLHRARIASIPVEFFDLDYLVMGDARTSLIEELHRVVANASRVFSRIGSAVLDFRPADTSNESRQANRLRRLTQQRAGTTVDRPAAGYSNSSKPAHLFQLARLGLTIPETCVTNDPQAAHRFWSSNRKLIYKGVSDKRVKANRLDEAEFERIDLVRNCPIMLQEEVDGPDCRIHTVFRDLFGIEVQSPTIDYRYAPSPELLYRPATAPAEVWDAVRFASRALGLALGGCDLKWSSTRRQWLTLEVNRRVDFGPFDHRMENQISTAIFTA